MQQGAIADGESSKDLNPVPNKIQSRSRYDSRPVIFKEKLRKQDGGKMNKTYDEGDLSKLPRTIA
ncbi:MAG: hypothetical protein Q9168_003194 [Polycauliona sp. 1 TL-2023]